MKFTTNEPNFLHRSGTPRKSIVEIYFPEREMTLTYYNSRFDLHPGNIVYVDGKLEGLRGQVTKVNYNFKIRLSDYQRVIAVADTEVHGQFFTGGSHFITFDPQALPLRKARTWFCPPLSEEDEIVSGSNGDDENTFPLADLSKMHLSETVAARGRDYYERNKVRYLCLEGGNGYAIVDGSRAYEVEFNYRDGMISNLICPCYCMYPCKHEFAAMLQLRETLEYIEKNYAEEYRRSGYFAAIFEQAMMQFVLHGNTPGRFTL